ncbi:MAG: TRZ/ATZ family hydrolase [Proteobacteria bacterium]|nr:TRZ/ATZ family hydrolase [Pseudomonadota bacterium]
MPPSVQAIHARWVIPVEPANTVLDHHTVVLEDSLIAAIVPTAQWRSAGPHVEEIPLPEHALIPGLVNAHTHAAMSLFRGMADDRPLMDWLENHIWPAEARSINREFVRDGTRLAAAEMLLGGTTCFNDMYFFGDEAASAAIEAGIRAVIGMIVIGFPSAWAADVDEYFRKGQAVHDTFRDHPLITSAFAPHAPYTVDDHALRRIATLAEELDVPVHMHVQETQDEVERAIAVSGVRPLRRLQGLGLVTPRLVGVHMTCLDDDELDLLAHSGATVVHCPESNLKLASGFCPVDKLLARGVNVACGTDGAASNNDLDMLGEIRTASLLAKGVAGDPCALPAAQALRMATYNGALALGLERSIGSLEIGKQADMVAIDLGDARARPVYDPVSQIIYSGHRDQVAQVWVGGRRVVRDRQLMTLDLGDLRAASDDWGQRIRQP